MSKNGRCIENILIFNILADLIQINNFKYKSSANTLNNNRIG